MKTLRLIGLTAFVVVLSLSITSCSDDDDPSDSCKIKKPTVVTNDDGSWIELSYDDEGRLIRKDEYNERGALDASIIFKYNVNNVVTNETYPRNSNYITNVCTLNSKGYVEKTVTSREFGSILSVVNSTYYYDSKWQLVGIKTSYDSDSDRVKHLIWKDGNLIKETGNGYSVEYSYSTIPSSKGFFVFCDDVMIDIFPEFSLEYLANCGYFGIVPQNMLSSWNLSWNGGYSELELSYEFGEDGYISKIIGKNNLGDSGWSKILWK